jgi:voltage-gated potassium channel|tara:strand:- start:104 stop:802 length:699 start_codon:yes stop_codon:yes gene_type:complete
MRNLFDKAIYALILLSVAAIIAESFQEFNSKYGEYLNLFESVTYIAFLCEYVYRVIDSVRQGSWRTYVFSFFGIVDLLAIVPFLLPFLITIDSRSIRVLRLVRLVSIFKIARHNKAVNTLISVVSSVIVEVGITLFTSFIAVVFTGILMFYAENESQPEVFSDMGQSIWWAVATLTTIGYGDIYPVTGMGKLIASSLAFIGIGLVAIPAGLISAAYVEEINKKNKKKISKKQ